MQTRNSVPGRGYTGRSAAVSSGMIKNRRWPVVAAVTVVLLFAAFFIYAGNYYHSDDSAREALVSDDTVHVIQTDYGWLFDGPSEDDVMIFYPGAKVEETAYAPFLRLMAEKGLDVCLVRMPFRFAFFGMNKADSIIRAYDYDRWYIGGHSLGGAIAASYAVKNSDLDGVIMFAAYPTKQLDPDDLELVIYGSEDEVVNMDKIIKGREYASDNAYEYEIAGGNHAQFGNYGIQSGDGDAAISAAEQQELAADFVIESISGQD